MEAASNWSDVTLADVCTLRAETVDPRDVTGLPYVGLEHIDSGQPRLRRHGSPAEVRSTKSCFYKGDILYGKLRPYLDKAVCVDHDGICSTDILVFAPEPSILSSFLIHLIHTPGFTEYAVKTTKGVNHPRTSWYSLSEFEFTLPQIAEQRAIARALDAVQRAKEARRRELALERERKAALMEHLFTHGTRGEPTKQSQIGEIPESWHVTRLGDACEFLQYGTSHRCDASGRGVPVLGIPNVVRGRVMSNGLKFLQTTAGEREKLQLRGGDLVFVRTNANREYTGRCAVFRNEIPSALFASYLIRARLNPESLLPNFVREYTDTWRGKTYLSGRASNAADGKFNINTQTIRGVLIPHPKLEEQREIAAVLAACDAKIDSLGKEVSLLEELFKAMLEELMTGRLSAVPLIEEYQPQ